MNRKCLGRWLSVVLLVAALPGTAARAATPAEVEASMVRAKEYLYGIQKKGKFHWERVEKRDDTLIGANTTGSNWGGTTALAVQALLLSGDSPQDPRLAPAIDFLIKADLVGTYAIAIRSQVMLLLPETPEIQKVFKRDLAALMKLMKTEGAARGFYDYDARGKSSSYSLSRSQYGVLGVWAAAQSGEEVPGRYWAEVERAWVQGQDKSGGWSYKPGSQIPVTAGITAAGIATLFIVQDQHYASRGVDCRNPTELPAIEKAIDWMTKNFDQVASEKEYHRDFPNPTLYAVERVGVAGGLKYFGTHDWYKKGTDYLLKRQAAKTGSYSTGGFGAVTDTCFGLMFLARGRAPVIINKLDWIADDKSAAGNWNRRPRDIGNLTRWVARTSEREFNWQIMTLDAPIADWHDAPILYLSGSDPIKIGKEHLAKMRQYVEDGGLIMVHADCGKGGFIGSTRKLASDLFPSYEFRELPDSHPLYTERFTRAKWKNKPSVLGLSNGARELMIFVPQADPAKSWQLGSPRNHEEHWQLGANVVFYATGPRGLRYKGDTYLVTENPAAKPAASMKLARLRYKGNWDPEPGGWRRLRNVLRNGNELDLTVSPVDLGTGSLDGIKLAHLTGTNKMQLDEPAKAQLKKFIAAGGTLLVDAAGGSEPFASSIESNLEAIFPGKPMEMLAPNHPLFGGKDAMKAVYRQYAQKTLAGKANAPRIKALLVGDRPAVLFSREDLSVGLVGNPINGVVGYEPATATELVRRIALTVAGVKPAAPVPAAQPATKPVKPEKPVKVKPAKAKATQPAPGAADGL
jgi:hypothetical protein